MLSPSGQLRCTRDRVSNPEPCGFCPALLLYSPLPTPRPWGSVPALSSGLCYAPLYPPSLLLTAGALVSSFLSTKFGIAAWYRKPPLLGGDLMKRMRNTLAMILLLYMIVSVFVAVERGSYEAEAVPLLLLLVLLWIGLLALGPFFSRVRQCSTRLSADERPANTGLRFDEVTRETGVIMERYVCPSASQSRSAAELEEDAFRVGFRGVFADAGNAGIRERSSKSDMDWSNAAYFARIAAQSEAAKKSRRGPSSNADPVLRHLEGALESINAAVIGAGGAKQLSQKLCVSVRQQPLPPPRREHLADGGEEEGSDEDPPGWPMLRL